MWQWIFLVFVETVICYNKKGWNGLECLKHFLTNQINLQYIIGKKMGKGLHLRIKKYIEIIAIYVVLTFR